MPPGCSAPSGACAASHAHWDNFGAALASRLVAPGVHQIVVNRPGVIDSGWGTVPGGPGCCFSNPVDSVTHRVAAAHRIQLAVRERSERRSVVALAHDLLHHPGTRIQG